MSANAFSLDWSKILSFSKSLPFHNQQILDSSNLKEFADDNIKSDENGRKFSEWLENTVRKKEKLLVMSNFSFSHCVFKFLVLEIRKNQVLFGKGLE